MGIRPGRGHALLTTAAFVGAVNALLLGLGATLLSGLFSAALGVAIAIGVVVALAAFAVQVGYINRASVSLGH
ncbi:hypothetical protein [Micromonospora narathiwatensis]|uniref:Uncharacterized protein n=1 Tax=Micromonospora narathiwatensis TaxID=299146 RepID=A0A1A8ZME5_9ACTN|nr:hypothetical protein [Micromonospora narathiwatensis]SBT45041.1 hypothetical protein GA0070621_2229 [Micromonospora narathiwatensis]